LTNITETCCFCQGFAQNPIISEASRRTGAARARAFSEPSFNIRSISAFLRRQWLEGALFGQTPEEAFFVKCDEETNPPEVRQAGQVVTEIGVNIVETAEFVIFRIGQWDGGLSITELV
jgi:hypothetical protein